MIVWSLWATIPAMRYVHLGLGVSLCIWAALSAEKVINLSMTVRANHYARPSRLLREGVYAQVRHPMYGRFILMFAGLGFALCSKLGIGVGLAAAALWTFNAVFEEKTDLIPHFGRQYLDYAATVRPMLFTPLQGTFLAVLMVVSMCGLFN